jgi:hypothetical protein
VRWEHAYLIDEEGMDMATRAGVFIVPTMHMTQEQLAALDAGAPRRRGRHARRSMRRHHRHRGVDFVMRGGVAFREPG